MQVNKFKKKLLEDEELLGTFINIPSTIMMEIIGKAGLDFAILDGEHAPFNPESFDSCIRTGDLCGLQPIVRVGDNFPVYIQRAVDLKPAAILVPQVFSKEDAEAAVGAAYFPPAGTRGLSPNTRFAGYSADNTADLTDRANENMCVICQAELVDGIKNLDDILAVKGVDAIYIGPYDLSASMGLPGEVGHPDVEEMMRKIVSKAKDHGKTVGTYCQTLEMAQKWRRAGVKFLTLGVDTAVVYEAFRNFVGGVREPLK